MDRILDINIKKLDKMLHDKRIVLEVSPEAKTWLADRGYDPVYGARPLKRVMQTEVLNKLATALIEGTVSEGDGVTVIVEGLTLGFKIEPGKGKVVLRELAAKGSAALNLEDDFDEE
jgi:ATP-dependent Clp protease ATP-binding subunit ClpA